MAGTSKNQRKYGRNAAYCKAYRLSNRREHNKIRRLNSHLKRFPDDKVALLSVESCKKTIRGY